MQAIGTNVGNQRVHLGDSIQDVVQGVRSLEEYENAELRENVYGIWPNPVPGRRIGSMSLILPYSKTLQEEREWIRNSFLQARLRQQCPATNGTSLVGTSVEELSRSVSRIVNERGSTSCVVLMLAHFWSANLRRPRVYVEHGRVCRGPHTVLKGARKAVCNEEKDCRSESSFLLSYQIDSDASLTLICSVRVTGTFETFGLAFTPNDVPVDSSLLNRLKSTMPAPDIWVQNQSCNANQQTYMNLGRNEVYVQRGLNFVRATITEIGHPQVNIEILEDRTISPLMLDMKPAMTPNVIRSKIFSGYQSQASTSQELPLFTNSCFIHIENGFPKDLENGRFHIYGGSSIRYDLIPTRIARFNTGACFATCSETLDVSLLYEIKSTDITLGIALKIQGKGNSFSAVLMPDQASFENSLSYLKDSISSNIHHYEKHAQATDGEQWIGMRNIRVSVRLTEEKKASLRIRICSI